MKLKNKPIQITNFEKAREDDTDVDDELREELYNGAYKKIIKEVIKVVVANRTTIDEELLDEGVNHIWNISSELYEVLIRNVNKLIKHCLLIIFLNMFSC